MSAAVDNELTRQEEQEFLLHLSECSSCNQELGDAKKTKLIVKERIIQFKAPQSLVNSIMQMTEVNAQKHENTLLFE